MKKTIYPLIAGALLATSVSSCVDLNQKPNSFLTEEEYIEYPKDIESVSRGVSALYNELRAGNYGFNCRIQRINVMADDITYATDKPGNPLSFYEDLTPTSSGDAATYQQLWSLFYKVIVSSNKIIEGTPVNKEDKALQAVIAEAYFMRGLSYFYLARTFGDVPLVLTKDDAEVSMPRTAVKEIYEKTIFPDLQKAAQDLPETSRSGDSSTPSKWAAKAALADAYMTAAGWPLKLDSKEYNGKAAKELKDIIDNSSLQLTAEYGDLWKEDKKMEANEHMFSLFHSVPFKTASNYGKSYVPGDFMAKNVKGVVSKFAGWKDYFGSAAFYEKYPEGARKEWNYLDEWYTATDQQAPVSYKETANKCPAIAKYYDYDNDGKYDKETFTATGKFAKAAQSNGLTSIYRYADVLLMYAEASVKATGAVSPEAQECLKKVQDRAGMAEADKTSTTDAAQFLEAVFDENGWEFFAEMRRWYDLVRLEKVEAVKPEQWANSLFKANNHYYIPIPSEQISLTGWENNPGY